mmetsp:Transcript_46447/g.113080  ORF Transcript_46447/g.113080 Transcript_46447/m.113080 type:complete len:217 (+) Transcript_46447:303-953(+)
MASSWVTTWHVLRRGLPPSLALPSLHGPALVSLLWLLLRAWSWNQHHCTWACATAWQGKRTRATCACRALLGTTLHTQPPRVSGAREARYVPEETKRSLSQASSSSTSTPSEWRPAPAGSTAWGDAGRRAWRGTQERSAHRARRGSTTASGGACRGCACPSPSSSPSSPSARSRAPTRGIAGARAPRKRRCFAVSWQRPRRRSWGVCADTGSCCSR